MARAMRKILAYSTQRLIAGFLAICAIVSLRYWPSNSYVLSKRDLILASRSHLLDEALGLPLNDTLSRRDTYQCSKSNPCSNGACCGGSGYCGYGPTYCGTGCVSNCNAVAQCGQYAPAGKALCPLNVCCSQFGFCGTTTDFCTTGCQSNCVEHPSPPGGASSVDVRKRVIGYYESWSARRSCHPMKPTQLPVDALTHINYAFAYIDPGSLQIVTMDTSTPADLFQETADVKTFKSGNSDLKVFVSVGGWTFSDNGTSTQPLYGAIAADAGKRQTFANNVVKFMDQYGFDGLDIDWEYPGAPDRGGTPADTANYVLLMKSLRSAFDASPRKPGLTFTAPTSFWYLRWFDMPGMVEYADWINFMAYDLHVWDQNDPIGNIVQGHTNLTEIQLAVELLWRVQVPPAKVVLGIGFYGRSFKLSDPSCSKPGCAFSGAGEPGSCTATAGILGYFEIMDILNQKSVSPVHDTTDAVMYTVWGGDNWVSYDSNDTFQQKVKWANNLGLGGLMIWSSDLDDKSFTAHSGLLGRSLAAEDLSDDGVAVAQDWSGQNGQQCTRAPECVDLNSPIASSCDVGFVSIGWDDGGCGRKNHHWGLPICCPVTAYPRSCIWRGDGGDCNGQCHAGEISLFQSSCGGNPTSGNTNCCSRGRKVFCCNSDQWAALLDTCSFSDCGKNCPSGTASVASKQDYGSCGTCSGGPSGHTICTGPYTRQFCCPTPVQFENCHWVGQGDCAQNSCASTDVELMTDAYGDGTSSCNWGRKKALCCNAPANQPFFLPVPLQDIFPTIPPLNDVPKFDLQFPHGGGGNPNRNAFGFVLVDGAPSAVASTKVKRDGSPSDLRFIDCEVVKKTTERQTLRFVCTKNDANSDCDDMMDGGIAGTVLEMPCGPGKYAVAHGVQDAADQALPLELAGIRNNTVKELTFDYRFDLVRRDAGEVYFRADYSNIAGYWNAMVDSPPGRRKKRSSTEKLDRRFWSDTPSTWGKLWAGIDVGIGSTFSADLTATLVSFTKDCGSGNKAYAEILSSGTVSGTSRMGVSMVGTISPDFDIQEVNAFMDTQLDLNLNLDFALYGEYGLAFTTQPLLQDPLTVDEFNHIGLLSIAPTLEVDVHLSARSSSQIAANFSTGVHAYTSSNIVQAFPGSALPSSGQTNQQTVQNTFSGEVYDASGGSIKIDVQPKLGMGITLDYYGMTGPILDGFIQGGFDAYNALNINNDKSFTVQMGTGAAIGDLTYTKSDQEFTQWSGDAQGSRSIGSANPARNIFSGKIGSGPNGSGPPKSHYIENDDNAVFKDFANFLTCPSGLASGKNITCDISLCDSVQGFCNDDDSEDGEGSLSRRDMHYKRGALAKRGKAREFTVDLGNGQTVVITSRPYPSRGVLFDGANGRQVLDRAFGFVNDDCEMTDILDEDTDNVNLDDYVTEHILELQTIANFIRTAVGGTLPSGQSLHTPTMAASFFQSTWNAQNLNNYPNVGAGISPTSLNNRVFEGLGSNTNRQDFVLCEEAVNAIKARFWSQINPIDVEDFQDLVSDAITNGGNPADFLLYLKSSLGFFNYISDPDIVSRLHETISVVRTQLQIGSQALAGGQNLVPIWDEFITDYLQTIGAYARSWIADRILDVRNLYGRANNPPNAQQVLSIIDGFAAELAGVQMPGPS